jgi:uncharacterized protein YjbJ (UPF0337 family)
MEVVMVLNRVEGNWKQVQGKVKEKWGKLTDDDLTAINGHRDQLECKIRERYGLSKDQARKEIDEWYGSQSCFDWPDLASPDYKFTKDELNEAPRIRPRDIDDIEI